MEDKEMNTDGPKQHDTWTKAMHAGFNALRLMNHGYQADGSRTQLQMKQARNKRKASRK